MGQLVIDKSDTGDYMKHTMGDIILHQTFMGQDTAKCMEIWDSERHWSPGMWHHCVELYMP